MPLRYFLEFRIPKISTCGMGMLAIRAALKISFSSPLTGQNTIMIFSILRLFIFLKEYDSVSEIGIFCPKFWYFTDQNGSYETGFAIT